MVQVWAATTLNVYTDTILYKNSNFLSPTLPIVSPLPQVITIKCPSLAGANCNYEIASCLVVHANNLSMLAPIVLA